MIAELVSGSRKAFVAAILVGAGLCVPAGAQSIVTNTSPYTDTSTMTNISKYLLPQPSATAGSNSSTVTQVGSNNSAVVDVSNYQGNTTVQTQFGNYNSSALSAVGNSNGLTTLQQGDSNTSTLSAVGNGNTLSGTQQGNNNSSSITAYGNNNTFNNTQIGSNLSYTLQRVGNGGSISVTQH